MHLQDSVDHTIPAEDRLAGSLRQTPEWVHHESSLYPPPGRAGRLAARRVWMTYVLRRKSDDPLCSGCAIALEGGDCGDGTPSWQRDDVNEAGEQRRLPHETGAAASKLPRLDGSWQRKKLKRRRLKPRSSSEYETLRLNLSARWNTLKARCIEDKPSRSPIPLATQRVGIIEQLCLITETVTITHKLNATTCPLGLWEPCSEIYSAIDLTDGFYQVRMRESDIPLTVVNTPGGILWEWLVMPHGLKIAPATFNRIV
ncbi:Reverse transcriptase-RNase H-integrase [Phytophthora megakarya]|uniref:Reverse transcriptase-RNase H-integrase n=1 Tax=Phytophthora megakarya TaxID=4795 RepID=A0A225WHP8_9STRA|nr:Reverse transcriptase-RNase H-integrase [Phytophthora megakarya]